MTDYDNDLVTVTLRVMGQRKRWAEFERVEMTVKEARELRQELAQVNYENAKPGDKAFIHVYGTLSQQWATEPCCLGGIKE